MKQNTRLAATHRLFEAVMGTSAHRTRHFDQILHTLLQVGRDVVVELPWAPGHRHLIRLKKVVGDRVYFCNPAKGSLMPGALLEDGLRRRVEADGLESASLEELRHLFERGGGEALLL